jgi:hypothetical protein
MNITRNVTAHLRRRQRSTLAAAIFLTLLPLRFTFDSGGIRSFLLHDEPQFALFWILAGWLWFRYQRRLQALAKRQA